MLPHAGLWNGGAVLADYAGATYQWTINYFEGAGMAPDPSLDNSVVLSNLMITGTPGDLSGNGVLALKTVWRSSMRSRRRLRSQLPPHKTCMI